MNKDFHIRGITRNPESAKAQELSKIGIEVVQADGWNREQMMKAFEGSWGVFVNTNTEDPVSSTFVTVTTHMRSHLAGNGRTRKAKGLESRVFIIITASPTSNLITYTQKDLESNTAGFHFRLVKSSSFSFVYSSVPPCADSVNGRR
jgi:hypothetical protein